MICGSGRTALGHWPLADWLDIPIRERSHAAQRIVPQQELVTKRRRDMQ